MVTAFNIESYKTLRVDPQDRTVELLQTISLQLASFSVNAAFINSTQSTLTGNTYEASTTNIAINTLWFLSLSLSLIAALFAIVALGWVQQYKDLSHFSGSKRARIRQARFKALDRWSMPNIIMSLAVLIQAALVLFFAGLMMLLWTINTTVAIVILSVSTASLVFYLATAAVPMFSPSCPYKSPLAWVINALICWALTPVVYVMSWFLDPSNPVGPLHPDGPNRSDGDVVRRRGSSNIMVRGLQWGQVLLAIMKSLKGRICCLLALVWGMRWGRIASGILKLLKGRISCRDLLQLEDRYQDYLVQQLSATSTVNAEITQIIDVIKWTAQTSSNRSMEYLAPCLLGLNVEPIEALCLWVGHTTNKKYKLESTTVETLLDDLLAYDAEAEKRQADCHQGDKSDVVNDTVARRDAGALIQRQLEDEMSMALLIHACYRAADHGEGDEYDNTLAGAALWLKQRGPTSNERRWCYLSRLAAGIHPSRNLNKSLTGIIDFLEIVIETYMAKPRAPGALGELHTPAATHSNAKHVSLCFRMS